MLQAVNYAIACTKNQSMELIMQIIKLFSYTCFGLAGLGVLIGLGNEELAFLALAVSLVVAGILLMALDKIITLLVEIRDAAVGVGVQPFQSTIVTPNTANTETSIPEKTMEELSTDLKRLASKL